MKSSSLSLYDTLKKMICLLCAVTYFLLLIIISNYFTFSYAQDYPPSKKIPNSRQAFDVRGKIIQVPRALFTEQKHASKSLIGCSVRFHQQSGQSPNAPICFDSVDSQTFQEFINFLHRPHFTPTKDVQLAQKLLAAADNCLIQPLHRVLHLIIDEEENFQVFPHLKELKLIDPQSYYQYFLTQAILDHDEDRFRAFLFQMDEKDSLKALTNKEKLVDILDETIPMEALLGKIFPDKQDYGIKNIKDLKLEFNLLYLAAKLNLPKIVKAILKRNKIIDPQYNDGKTPLNAAAFAGHLNIVKMLVDAGANINKIDNDGWTPINSASASQNPHHLDIIKYLTEHQADINIGNNLEGWTAVHHAAYAGDLPVLKYFLQKKIDIHQKDKFHTTGLHFAAYQGHQDVVQLFVENGGDIHHKDQEGFTPLMNAFTNNQWEIVKYFIEIGANIEDMSPNSGLTPLAAAVTNNNLSMINFLIKRGANLHHQFEDGSNIFDLALHPSQGEPDSSTIRLLEFYLK